MKKKGISQPFLFFTEREVRRKLKINESAPQQAVSSARPAPGRLTTIHTKKLTYGQIRTAADHGPAIIGG